MGQLINKIDREEATKEEREVTEWLRKNTAEDVLIWDNIPIKIFDKNNVFFKEIKPNFLLLIPKTGLLCLEVKDWKLEDIKKTNPINCELLVEGKIKPVKNPNIQAQQYLRILVEELKKQPELVQKNGEFEGKLSFLYDCGVIFTNIAAAEISNLENWNKHFVKEKTIYSEVIKNNYNIDERLEKMFKSKNISNNFIDLKENELQIIKNVLFPEQVFEPQHTEIQPVNAEKTEEKEVEKVALNIENKIKERLENQKKAEAERQKAKAEEEKMRPENIAKNLGAGHRVIHGVAGSGKTQILANRARILAENNPNKKILITCFNKALAFKLQSILEDIHSENIEIIHFHAWVKDLLKRNKIKKNDYLSDEEKLYRLYLAQPLAALRALEQGKIKEKYPIILVDEGQDFSAEWLKLLTGILEPEGDLLFLYDDAQNIFQRTKKSSFKFSLASVGIKAVGRGRSMILRKNWRNTKEIISFAWDFAKNKLSPQEDSEIPIIAPESCGRTGEPVFVEFRETWEDELLCMQEFLHKWLNEEGVNPSDIAVICPSNNQCIAVMDILDELKLPYWTGDKSKEKEAINLLNTKTCKGLEFNKVVLMGCCRFSKDLINPITELYVAMTRAKESLVITVSSALENNEVKRLLTEIYLENNQEE